MVPGQASERPWKIALPGIARVLARVIAQRQVTQLQNCLPRIERRLESARQDRSRSGAGPEILLKVSGDDDAFLVNQISARERDTVPGFIRLDGSV